MTHYNVGWFNRTSGEAGTVERVAAADVPAIVGEKMGPSIEVDVTPYPFPVADNRRGYYPKILSNEELG
jgi:hypothetical protein